MEPMRAHPAFPSLSRRVDSRLLGCHPLLEADFVSGDGCHLVDDAGRRFLDLESGSWAAVLGHGHPVVTAALTEQAVRLMHLGVRTPNRLAEEAATRLLSRAGLADGFCSFLSSGSEAVELGVQAIRRLTGRPLLATLASAYFGAVGDAAYRRPESWIEFQPDADLDAVPWERVGGLVLELGGGSPHFVRFPSEQRIAELVRRVRGAGGLVMVNEVTTGFGRLGTWFGFEQYGLRPDLVAVGKGLGNGYPVSALMCSGVVGKAIASMGLLHAQSHQNNPLGCAVALAVMKVLEEEDWIGRGARTGALLRQGLEELRAGCSAVQDVRGKGMLLGLELSREGLLDGATLQARLWERGVIVAAYPRHHPAGTGLRLDPPLVLEAVQVTQFLEKLADCLTLRP